MTFGIGRVIIGAFILTCGSVLLPTGLFYLPGIAGVATGAAFVGGGAAIASFGGGMFIMDGEGEDRKFINGCAQECECENYP